MQIDVQARVASYGEDGVGLGFILPAGMNAGLWEHVVDTADTPDETEDTQCHFQNGTRNIVCVSAMSIHGGRDHSHHYRRT